MVIGEHIPAWFKQVEAAAKRYADTEMERQEVEQARKEAGSMVVDKAEQIIARSDRLLTSGEVPLQAVIEVGKANPLDELATRERIIGVANQMQAVSFLPRGVRAATSIARITLSRNGRGIPHGSRVADLAPTAVTGNHVLPDADTARDVVIEFGAELDRAITKLVELEASAKKRCRAMCSN